MNKTKKITFKFLNYRVTRTFTSGLLSGMNYTEITTIPWELGRQVKSQFGSDYTITKVESV